VGKQKNSFHLSQNTLSWNQRESNLNGDARSRGKEKKARRKMQAPNRRGGEERKTKKVKSRKENLQKKKSAKI
jgi:hypothetical protein